MICICIFGNKGAELVMLAQSLEGTGWNIKNKIWRMKIAQMRVGAHKEVSGGTGSPH